MLKKNLLVAAILCVAISLVGLTAEVNPAMATFTHTWTLSASAGLGGSPVSNKECGLWDNAPGATGMSTGRGAVLWIECDNGGDGGGPYENEYCRWRTTQIDVDPAAGWNRLYVRYCRQTGITFRVRVKYSVGGTATVLSDSSSTTWQTRMLSLGITGGRIVEIAIEIDDTNNYLGYTIDVYMVLLDYILLRNSAGSIIWQENF